MLGGGAGEEKQSKIRRISGIASRSGGWLIDYDHFVTAAAVNIVRECSDTIAVTGVAGLSMRTRTAVQVARRVKLAVNPD